MQDSVVTATSSGRVRGVRSAGVYTYLGIPYGASVAGAGRFKEVQSVELWGGVRDAFALGCAAPQLDPRLDSHGTWAQVFATGEMTWPRFTVAEEQYQRFSRDGGVLSHPLVPWREPIAEFEAKG